MGAAEGRSSPGEGKASADYSPASAVAPCFYSSSGVVSLSPFPWMTPTTSLMSDLAGVSLSPASKEGSSVCDVEVWGEEGRGGDQWARVPVAPYVYEELLCGLVPGIEREESEDRLVRSWIRPSNKAETQSSRCIPEMLGSMFEPCAPFSTLWTGLHGVSLHMSQYLGR